MNRKFLLQRLSALLLVLLSLAPVALAADGEDAGHIRFTWTTGGQPALVELPLPQGLAIAEIERASLPGHDALAGMGLEARPPRLELYPQPAPGEVLRFGEVDLELATGPSRRFEFGHAEVVALGPAGGPLEFQRSLAAPAAGLYQAVALRNSGERALIVTASDYLPEPLEEGRLLVAVGETGSLLATLEAAMSPAALREARRTGTPYPLAQGFGWRAAADLALELAPGETAVIAWTDASLPANGESLSYALRPLVEYRVAPNGRLSRLGLPVTVERRP